MKRMSKLFEDLKTPLDHFYHWEKSTPDKVFLRQPFGNDWFTLTYQEAGVQARKMRNALFGLGLERGDHIGIMSKNCYHWILADLAIMMGGFVSVPYYSSLHKNPLNEVIIKSEIKAIFLGKLDHWGDRDKGIPDNLTVIKFPPYKGNAKIERGIEWDELIESNDVSGEDFSPNIKDLWTILFTSGTTGSPKGVMHTYENTGLVINVEKHSDFIGINKMKDNNFFSFLPLNHVAERIAVEVNCLGLGGTISFAESIDTFAKNLQETQPNIIFAVPRIWTKFYQGVLSKISQKKLDVLLKIPIVKNVIKQKLLTAMGLKNAEIILTGAAITPIHLKEWYKKLGVHLIEVYGMTEVCGGIVAAPDVNTPMDSVGQALPFCEIKIDPETKEVLMKAPFVMKGYFKEAEKTKEILRDGWIYSGDRGELDDNGYVKIIGRVKDSFKTAKGKYVVPNPMEEVLASNEFIEQICITGHGIPQPIALVNLSEQTSKLDKDDLNANLASGLESLNKNLAAFEKISTIIITKESWTEKTGLLTPTMKIRRGAIYDCYCSKLLKWHEDQRQVIWE